MFKILGAAVAAATLSFAGEANALISFQSIGDQPVVRVDSTPLPGNRPGSFAIDTITPLDQVNVLVRFDRETWMTHFKYDYLDAFVALGELQGIMTIHGVPAPYGSSRWSSSIGDFVITYSGEPITVNGKTFHEGDELLRTRFRHSYPFGPYTWSDFMPTGSGVSAIDVTHLNPVREGYIMTSGLSGYVAYGVPEPATWAMLIIGFGLSGVSLRKSRRRMLA